MKCHDARPYGVLASDCLMFTFLRSKDIAPLSEDQKDLILYCLEQQYYEFNKAEQADYDS